MDRKLGISQQNKLIQLEHDPGYEVKFSDVILSFSSTKLAVGKQQNRQDYTKIRLNKRLEHDPGYEVKFSDVKIIFKFFFDKAGRW